jgi:Cu(I)/Ag(I) efflux system membrane fusion protein
MKFITQNIYTISSRLFLALIMLIITESCDNTKSDSSENMKGMDNMKTEISSDHDTMKNMDGMDMSGNNTEGMNTSDNTSSRLRDSLKIGSLVMQANYRVVSSQKSIKPIKYTNTNGMKAQGYISIDERRNNKVSLRISGRIEKLYIKYNFQYVKKGEKIIEIYSPELNTYQEELLLLLKDSNDFNLADKAEEKLRLLGVTQTQIDDIKRTGNTFSTIDIYSPQDGYVFFKPLAGMGTMKTSTSSNANGKMGGMGNAVNISNSEVSADGQIREGNYVNKGDVLFWVNDLKEVWAIVAVDNSHQQELKAGANVLLISELYNKDTIHAKINFLEPVYQQNQKFIMSRIYLNNSDKKYKINSLLEAKISSGKSSSLMVPYSSVLFLGKRKIVWVLKEKTTGNSKIYEARDVIIGLVDNGMVEIKSGLNINEEIAIDAGYLIDRESLIKPE